MEGKFDGPETLANGELHPDAPIPIVPLLVLVLGGFMAILDTTVVTVALPKLMGVFGAGPDKIQWVVTGYLLGSGVVVPPSGFLADRVGMRKVYVFALVIFTAGSLLCSMAWNVNVLIAFRVLQAVGGGMIMPLSLSMLYLIVPKEKIGAGMGVWGIAAAVAPALGPVLGGWLVDRFDWRLIFTINVPVGILTIILVLLILPEFPAKPHLQFDLPGASLAAGGAFAFLLALSEGQQDGWTSLFIVTLLVVGIFAFILFVLWELRQREPMIDIRLLRNGVFTASLAASGLVFAGLQGTMFLVPMLVQKLMGYTPLQSGLMLLPSGLMMGVITPISGRLFDRVGAFWPAVTGLTVAAAVTYGMHNLGLLSTYHGIQITMVFWVVGVALAMMPTITSGMFTIPPALVSRAASLSYLVRTITGSMGIAFLVYVMTSREVFHYNWLASTVTRSSPAAQRITQWSAHLGSHAAVTTFASLVLRQAAAMGYDDAFVAASIMLAVAIPLAFFLTKSRMDAARARETAAWENGGQRRDQVAEFPHT